MLGRKGSLLAAATALLGTCGAACAQGTARATSKVVSGHEEFQSVVTSVSPKYYCVTTAVAACRVCPTGSSHATRRLLARTNGAPHRLVTAEAGLDDAFAAGQSWQLLAEAANLSGRQHSH
jgi:hypothetical protein